MKKIVSIFYFPYLSFLVFSKLLLEPKTTIFMSTQCVWRKWIECDIEINLSSDILVSYNHKKLNIKHFILFKI